MIIIHPNNQFERCLEYLNRSGGAAALAAKRANNLLKELADSPNPLDTAACRPTRNGEARIRKCRKFDLGNGYRLVSIVQEGHIFPLFAGSHDDCDRWIENNRGAELDLTSTIPTVETTPITTAPLQETVSPPEVDYDDELVSRISEKELRMVFKGLWESPSTPVR